MLHQLLQLLPHRLLQARTIVLVWGNVVGMLLWMLGGRFSRLMLTVLAIAAGASVGVRLPHVFGLLIEPRFAGMFCAIGLGTAAYLFHRTLVGTGLGALVAIWAVTAAWIRFDGPNQWQPTGLYWSSASLLADVTKCWQALPGKLGLVLPYAGGGGFSIGALTGVLWSRLGRCLLYSLIGTTLILATGLPLASRLRPGWLEVARRSPQTQPLYLAAFVCVGVAAQWCLTGRRHKRRTVENACGDAASGAHTRDGAAGLSRNKLSPPVPVVRLPVH
jgi:hypothetical protein